MEHEKIYPDLERRPEGTEAASQLLNNKLKFMRRETFESDLIFLTDKLNHYNKLLKRWKNINSALKYTNLGLSIFIGLGGVILIGVTEGLIIPAIALSTGPIVSNAVNTLFNLSLTRNKIKKYRNLINELETTKNKLFLYHQKCLKDNELTDEEIKTSKAIVKKVKNKLMKIKEETININNDNEKINFLLEKIKEYDLRLK